MNRIRRYYNTKKATSKQRGIPFELELRDLHWLLHMARIDISQVGKRKGQYLLSRLGDTGPYAIGNCRFVTAEQNGHDRTGRPNPADLKAAWARNPARKEALRERNRLGISGRKKRV